MGKNYNKQWYRNDNVLKCKSWKKTGPDKLKLKRFTEKRYSGDYLSPQKITGGGEANPQSILTAISLVFSRVFT